MKHADLLEREPETKQDSVEDMGGVLNAHRTKNRQRCEIWTRVMGYYRPVFSFNRGKLGEYKTRVYYELP